PPL
ncbi:UBN2 domain-containing protein, partial [Cephalotus follicularis]